MLVTEYSYVWFGLVWLEGWGGMLLILTGRVGEGREEWREEDGGRGGRREGREGGGGGKEGQKMSQLVS